MNVVHINSTDAAGGAAVAAHRLHDGLLSGGAQSTMLVGTRTTASRLVARIPAGEWRDRWLNDLTRRIGLNYVAMRSARIADLPFYQNADVVNLHSLHGGYFNYVSLPSLTARKAAVYTLHEMYAFTGHCSFSYECGRYRTGCGRCPHPEEMPSIGYDATRVEWRLKDRAYRGSNLTIVAPSRWMATAARESMLGRFPVHHIPNGLDTEAYRPLDRAWCRRVLELPPDRTVVMLAATSMGDRRKGADLAASALAGLSEASRREIVLLALGHAGEGLATAAGTNVLSLGYVTHDRLKAIAFSAADMLLLPSRLDNLPVVIQEAMACGIPTIAFDAGGVPDMVRPGTTGVLVPAEDVTALRDAIARLIDDRAERERLGAGARAVAVAEYELKVIVPQYLSVYREAVRLAAK